MGNPTSVNPGIQRHAVIYPTFVKTLFELEGQVIQSSSYNVQDAHEWWHFLQ